MLDNTITAALRRTEPDEIGPALKSVIFRHGDVLAEAGQPIEHVFFPASGLISIVIDLNGGESIESAMIGHDGVVGGAAAFGGKIHINTALAQIPGQGWAMRAADFSNFVRQNPQLEALLVAHEQFMLAQAQQTAACNARHHIPQRMVSWFLRASDATGENELHLTQEYMAQMLGVQRASVSVFAAQLQDEGYIRYRRGRVTIMDRDRLVEKACECYGALCKRRDALYAANVSNGYLHAHDLHQPAVTVSALASAEERHHAPKI